VNAINLVALGPGSNILLAASIEPTAINRTCNVNSNRPSWNNENVENLNSNDKITSIEFAPSNPSVAYAISESGRVYRNDDVMNSIRCHDVGRLNTTTAKQVVINPLHYERIYVIS
jgi:hypothetical protein